MQFFHRLVLLLTSWLGCMRGAASLVLSVSSLSLSLRRSLHHGAFILPSAIGFHGVSKPLVPITRNQQQNHQHCLFASSSSSSTESSESSSTTTMSDWKAFDDDHAKEARQSLEVWPLDEHNTKLLNEVHPRDYPPPTPHDVYDIIAVGAGAGGLVTSRQSARRGAKSAMISEYLAGGDCLNVGCVPSKALIRSARAIQQVRKAQDLGVKTGPVEVDFPAIMRRMRELRAHIAPADGHALGVKAGSHVFQGRGRFTGPDTIEVNGTTLRFRKAVVATGGRPSVPNVPGLKEAPYTTNEILFNTETLPPRMVILGAGVIALEMAQTFATFGSEVFVVQRSERLFQSKGGDEEAAALLRSALEEDGVKFVTGGVQNVETLRERDMSDSSKLPLMKVVVSVDGSTWEQECEMLLVATGRVANVEDVGLEAAGVDYQVGKGVTVNDLSQSVSNPNVYAVGDCCAGVARLTHMSGEMAKQVVQNALFGDDWKLSDFVVPAVAYTEPEFATVGIAGQEEANKKGIEVDVYRAGLEHNDRAILESDNRGFCKIFCEKGTDNILGCVIVAARAGEMINEVTLAMKYGIGLKQVGRNIHSYPTTGEAVMGCGIQYINSHWERLD